MLTEEIRGIIVDRINSLDFTYEGNDPQVKVYRYGEGFTRINPTILVQFLPANRKKFQSVSNVIGYAENGGNFYRYGYCQIELCSIHCYAQEKHEDATKTVVLNGRLICADMAEKCLADILKSWDGLLTDYNVTLDFGDMIPFIKDVSTYDPVTETRIYNYDIDVYLRTPFTWDKVPDGYDQDSDLADIIEVEAEEVLSGSKKKIIIKFS